MPERERIIRHNRQENSSKPRNMDAIVIGMGVLGLMLAKRLTDFGQSVAVIEQSPTIADGPSIKNHGWLHTGVVHSLSTAGDAKLVRKLQYGHRFFSDYAPECLDEPFDPTYAIAREGDLAQKARDRWTEYRVPYRELTDGEFFQIEPDIDQDAAQYYFETEDSRVNNRLLFAKLLADIRHRGAAVLTAASYEYEDDNTIVVEQTDEDIRHRLHAPLFFYATGGNLGTTYEKLTNEHLPIEYWKSHLLVMPRITEASIVGLDRNSPIIINHGKISVVNRSYDEAPTKEQDFMVDQEEVERAFDVLVQNYPKARNYADNIHAIACLKPHIPSAAAATRHSVDEVVCEPKDGHVFALPGKMTEAPYIADSLVRDHQKKLNLGTITERPIDAFNNR